MVPSGHVLTCLKAGSALLVDGSVDWGEKYGDVVQLYDVGEGCSLVCLLDVCVNVV